MRQMENTRKFKNSKNTLARSNYAYGRFLLCEIKLKKN